MKFTDKTMSHLFCSHTNSHRHVHRPSSIVVYARSNCSETTNSRSSSKSTRCRTSSRTERQRCCLVRLNGVLDISASWVDLTFFFVVHFFFFHSVPIAVAVLSDGRLYRRFGRLFHDRGWIELSTWRTRSPRLHVQVSVSFLRTGREQAGAFDELMDVFSAPQFPCRADGFGPRKAPHLDQRVRSAQCHRS
jgi:hypothetical protein